jgi:hypothetical protein
MTIPDALGAILGFLLVIAGVAVTWAIGPAMIVAGVLLLAFPVVKWLRMNRSETDRRVRG